MVASKQRGSVDVTIVSVLLILRRGKPARVGQRLPKLILFAFYGDVPSQYSQTMRDVAVQKSYAVISCYPMLLCGKVRSSLSGESTPCLVSVGAWNESRRTVLGDDRKSELALGRSRTPPARSP
jgi:hypothetical protein